MTSRAAISIAALVAGGCTWGEPPRPVIAGVSAEVAPLVRGAKTIVTVTGSGFEPGVVVDFDDPGRSEVCAGLRVELRAPGQSPVVLSDARILSPTEVRARVEGDVPRDTWDVVLTDARGAQATLPAALEIVRCSTEPPNQPCDDGEPCTADDRCTGAARCEGIPAAPDVPCDFGCTNGATVAGSCQAGACRPLPGLCDPVPACSAP